MNDSTPLAYDLEQRHPGVRSMTIEAIDPCQGP
jgi:hypothetical protein